MREKLKRKSGITLIALVITIIVMLILVAVTINMAINGGLFEKAGEAVRGTQDAINAEQKLADGRIKIGDKWYASIDDYLNNNPIEQGIRIEEAVKLEIEADYNVETSTKVTKKLTATLNEIEGTPTWTSSNETVATVDQTGLVTAVAIGEAEIKAKVEFEGETYEAKCKVTVAGPTIELGEITENLKDYQGKTVNYSISESGYTGEWEIFYADDEHIYIITKGSLASAALKLTDNKAAPDTYSYQGTGDFTAENLTNRFQAVAAGLFNKTYDPNATGNKVLYSSSNTNMKATEYLLDSTNWSSYVNNDYAEWAIGGPTYELFVKSYNAYYTSETKPSVVTTFPVILETPSRYGYGNPLSSSGSVPYGTHLNRGEGYYLACPHSYYDNSVYSTRSGDNCILSGSWEYSFSEFRPVVCLRSNVQLNLDSANNQYNLVLGE